MDPTFATVEKPEDIAAKNTEDSVNKLTDLVAKYLWNV